MSTDSRLNELLLRWEEMNELGQPMPVDQLCVDAPDLAKELGERIAMLQYVDDLLQPRPSLAETITDCQAADGVGPSLPSVPGYELLEELGRGGMGVVYKARQVNLDRLVALKMILAGSMAGRQELARMQQEAMVIARLRHPAIVQVFDVGQHAGCPFLALEFIADGCLADRLDGTPWHANDAAALVRVLAEGVQAAHDQGIIHRDMKPGNVLMDRPLSETDDAPNSIGNPKITDFGLAKVLTQDSSQTRTGAVMGTPSYMAPEQAEGRNEDVGPTSDVYALGAILYELLAGRPPFKAASTLETIAQVIHQEPVQPSRLQPGLARDLETICMKCLAKESARRYRTAADLASDLGRFLRGEPILARPTGAWVRAAKWARRRPAVAGLVAVSCAALLALLTAGLYYNAQLRVAKGHAENKEREAREAQLIAERKEQETREEHQRAEDALAVSRGAQQTAELREQEAKAEWQRAEDALAVSRKRLVLNYLAYGRVCTLASRIANAGSLKEADRSRAEFARVRDGIAAAGDEKVKAAVARFDERFRAWTDGPQPDDLEQVSLGLARTCNDAYLDLVDREVSGTCAAIRRQLYARACELAENLASARTWELATDLRQEFWELYWGELAIVESKDVERAMVSFGRVLKTWDKGRPPLELRQLVMELREACGDTGRGIRR